MFKFGGFGNNDYLCLDIEKIINTSYNNETS